MKKIKICLVGFHQGFDFFKTSQPWAIFVRNNYDVQIVNNDADYLIVNTCGPAYESLKIRHKISLFITHENVVPDFNVFDYAISPYPLYFLDRHFFYPQFAWTFGGIESMIVNRKKLSLEDIKMKDKFCNFIYSHNDRDGWRKKLFELISSYKTIDSAGSYLNNQQDSFTVRYLNSSKTDFQKKCKFTLCIESVNQPGFATEKITDALNSRTIPIYLGSKTVENYFNKKAFINVSDYDDLNQLLERIKTLDEDDEQYLQIINEDPFTDSNFLISLDSKLCDFLKNIFEQDIDGACRRSKYLTEKKFTDFISGSVKCRRLINVLLIPKKIYLRLKRIFRK